MPEQTRLDRAVLQLAGEIMCSNVKSVGKTNLRDHPAIEVVIHDGSRASEIPLVCAGYHVVLYRLVDGNKEPIFRNDRGEVMNRRC